MNIVDGEICGHRFAQSRRERLFYAGRASVLSLSFFQRRGTCGRFAPSPLKNTATRKCFHPSGGIGQADGARQPLSNPLPDVHAEAVGFAGVLPLRRRPAPCVRVGIQPPLQSGHTVQAVLVIEGDQQPHRAFEQRVSLGIRLARVAPDGEGTDPAPVA